MPAKPNLSRLFGMARGGRGRTTDATTCGVPAEAVPSPANGPKKIMLPDERHGGLDISDIGTSDDERGPSVDRSIPHSPMLLVAMVAPRKTRTTTSLTGPTASASSCWLIVTVIKRAITLLTHDSAP